MKVNRFYPKHTTLGLLMLGLIATTSIQAQMLQAQPGQAASNDQFEASMYPMNGNDSSPAIRVNFNNLTHGSVRLVIRDSKGKVFYDEYEPTVQYRRRFDLSSIPAGEYTVELSKRGKQYMQTFVIDSPIGRHIALKAAPAQDNSKNLAVKQ